MRTALTSLREFRAEGRKIVVSLDDPWASTAVGREKLGKAIVQNCGVDLLIAKGASGQQVLNAARAAGMQSKRLVWVPSSTENRPIAGSPDEKPNGEITLRSDKLEQSELDLQEIIHLVSQVVQPGDAVLLLTNRGAAIDEFFGRIPSTTRSMAA